MKYFYITGTSRGIGKSLAEELLKDQENHVIGISRTSGITDSNYTHFFVDLSDPEQAGQFEFITRKGAESITLVNNSAVLGSIRHVGERTNAEIIREYTINIISPHILMNGFIKAYQKNKCKRQIINISSGAGRHPVESWSTYCSTKAALDMTSRVIKEEQNRCYPDNPVRIWSVAPGIVDTQMQDEIRLASEKEFGRLQEFIDYKMNDHLQTTEGAAQDIIKIIENPTFYKKVLLDVRNTEDFL